MEEYYKKEIHRLAEEIREEMKGGKIFGEPIDFDSIDTMIVAAYFYGESHGGRKDFEIYMKLFNKTLSDAIRRR